MADIFKMSISGIDYSVYRTKPSGDILYLILFTENNQRASIKAGQDIEGKWRILGNEAPTFVLQAGKELLAAIEENEKKYRNP